MKKFLFLIFVFIIGLNGQDENKSMLNKHDLNYRNVLPVTTQVDLSIYSEVVYVSYNSNGDGDGSKEKPFTSISQAVNNLNGLSSSNKAAILVGSGVDTTDTIMLKEYINLYGGFNPGTWERDIEKYKSEISGVGDSRIFVAANNIVIDGFIISGAHYRGKGAAIYCDGTSPTITNNTFTNNMTLKPLEWNPKYWHETANDGGAIYGKDGASPVIKNNLFVKNKTENGRGAAIAFDNECDPKIISNVFFNNHTGLDDPQRSSDGGAVSIFRWCKGTVKGNIFLSNLADNNNDGGGLFVALWSSTVVKNNLFVDNESGDDAGALFVGGQEHRYDSPLDPYPPKDKFFVTIEGNSFIGNRNPSMNSGAMRFTMESRGRFSNNIVAQNNGVYFQRSETEIVNNVILDNTLVIETKEGLNKSVIKDNLIWADFFLDETDVELQNNNMLYADDFPGNVKKLPKFIDDGFELPVLSAYYLKANNYSELIINNSSDTDLTGRIIKADDKWSVVKSYSNNVLELWGNFSKVTSIYLLPTYTIEN